MHLQFDWTTWNIWAKGWSSRSERIWFKCMNKDNLLGLRMAFDASSQQSAMNDELTAGWLLHFICCCCCWSCSLNLNSASYMSLTHCFNDVFCYSLYSMRTTFGLQPKNISTGDWHAINQWQNQWLPAWPVRYWPWATYTSCQLPKAVPFSHATTYPISSCGAGKPKHTHIVIIS